MTAPAQQPAPDSPRPALRVVATCEQCKQPVAEARDRHGGPVRLDCDGEGRAVRHPTGMWWAAKLGSRWCVVQVQAGEDPPASGGGVRYAEHRCTGVDESELLDLVAAKRVDERSDDPLVRRPGGRAPGLDGPACPDWYRLGQAAPDGGPYHRMCVRCGRVTPRSDGDGLAWCGGEIVPR